jgi:hypothetical protein
MKNYDANPFNPQFGKRPERFIGRELMLNDFLQSLGDRNDPNRTTVVTGIRGSGKTALLSDVHESLGDTCVVIDVTARDGMLLEILDGFIRGSKGKGWLDKGLDGYQGFSVGALGFSLGLTKKGDKESHSFRFMVSEALDRLRERDVKTVFLIDEAHNGTLEMRELVVTYQHLVRENYDVAFLMAGLPSSVNDVLNDKVLTFLRRAHRVELESIDVKAVEFAYDQAFRQAGRGFAGDSLGESALATEGYPYLIQLLGYFLFNSGEKTLDSRLVQQALELSKAELFKNVHDLLFQEMSARDRDFLLAMTEDEGHSDFGAVRGRLGVSAGYASKYRERLLAVGMVRAVAHGKLAFAPPYMREYLLTKV